MAEPTSDFNVAKLGAGIAGAVTSLRFVKGTWQEKTIMVIGGCAFSYYASEFISSWLAMQKAEGLIGYLCGLFGMAVISKIYEVIQMLDAKQIATDAWAWVVRKWGA
ncbi:hypothetical protein J2W35_004964 [Variovorax boronicumulans]|uniref:hypothetical protein n=1 Tax=Variovorax boronicumulans TaxID=436515 RepID=UPI00277DC11F|nr:hypothetical protein [Variovorax boronicumulans]MDQ0084595.1 hypothetical protein [Variovorax boronicumulans]